MKYIMILFAMVVLLLTGCFHESPLTKKHSIAIDSTLLGLWGESKANKKDSMHDERMLILKYSDTEYLIHYPTGKKGMYFRGYPIKIGGVSCVQLQVIGAKAGPPLKSEKDLFCVASYQLKDGQLEIKLLNLDLIDDDLKTTGELRKAFLANKGNKELFSSKDPGIFRRIIK